jgi:hypothetical protein
MAPFRPHPARRLIFGSAGIVFALLGAAGLVLPLVPGTLFLIIAAYCFARSSQRMESWLVNHPRLGPPIRRWHETRAIPRRAKIVAVVSMAASLGLMSLTSAPPIALGATALLMLASAAYVVSRPDG